MRVSVENGLPEETTVHWHGLRVENAMDGVPDMPVKPIAPGETFLYDFVPPDAGTYWFHPHVGMQLDRGLYGALIVEPRQESLSYDAEATLVLDDWIDGIAGTPDAALDRLLAEGMQMPGMSGMDGMDMEGMDMGGMGMGERGPAASATARARSRAATRRSRARSRARAPCPRSRTCSPRARPTQATCGSRSTS